MVWAPKAIEFWSNYTKQKNAASAMTSINRDAWIADIRSHKAELRFVRKADISVERIDLGSSA